MNFVVPTSRDDSRIVRSAEEGRVTVAKAKAAKAKAAKKPPLKDLVPKSVKGGMNKADLTEQLSITARPKRDGYISSDSTL